MCNQKDCEPCKTLIPLNPVTKDILENMQTILNLALRGFGGYSYNDVTALKKLVDDLEYCAAHS